MSEFVSGDRAYNHMVFGPTCGLFANAKYGRVILQPEVLYAKKGCMSGQVVSGQTYNEIVRLKYFVFPILVKYTSNKPQFPIVYLGPYYGRLVSAQAHIESSSGTYDCDVSGTLERSDFGLTLGAEMKMGSALFAEIRYEPGLTDIRKEGLAPSDGARNSTTYLMAGILF